MVKNNSIQERIDMDFRKMLKEISLNRIKNGLEDDLIPAREVTRMIPNADNWKKVKEELETKPRKKID